MRVVLVSPNFYPRIGGIESHLVEVVRNIGDVEFVVVTNSRKDAARRSALFPKTYFAHVWPSDLETRKWLLLLPPSLRIGQSFGGLLERLRTLNRLGWLRRLDADIIHVHYFELDHLDRADRRLGMPALIGRRYRKIAAAMETRAPLLFTDHTVFTAPGELVPEPTKEALLASIRNIISVDLGSYGVVRSFQARHGGRSWFIPNSVDSDVFRPKAGPEDGFTVGFAARVGKLGEDLMHRVTKIVGDRVEWHIALGGESIDLARAPIAQMAQNVQLYSNLDYLQMPGFYNGIDVFINPFPGQGVGRTTLEAMACGLPVISVGTTEKYPVQSGKTGYLLPPDPEPIAETIIRLRDDRALRKSLGQNGRSVIVDEFSNRVLLPKLREVYSTLAQEA